MLTLMRSSSLATRALAALLLLGALSPAAGWTKKPEAAQTYNQNDTTYQYVSAVFDKLQTYWEKQASDQRLGANAVLTFTLDDQGKLINSQSDSSNDPEAMAFIRQNAPFGPLPENLTGNRLEFSFKLAPDSMQMVSYRILEDRQRRNDVISYSAPAGPTPAVASLFYARVVDTVETPKAGKVWEKPETRTNDEQAMDQYVTSVRESIQQKWHQPDESLTFAPAKALLQIDRDGSLLSAALTQSSGNKNIDKAIMNTIFQAAPFTGAPDNIKSLPVTLEYVFEPYVSTVYVQE